LTAETVAVVWGKVLYLIGVGLFFQYCFSLFTTLYLYSAVVDGNPLPFTYGSSFGVQVNEHLISRYYLIKC